MSSLLNDGIIGITENDSALRRWMIAGPELARILHDIENCTSPTIICSDRHHEKIVSTQKRFATNVRSVIEVFNEFGNPFTETSDNLFALDTKVIMSENVIDNITTAEPMGREQYESFVESHLLTMDKPFNDNIKKNNLQFFKSGERKNSSAAK